MSRRTPRLRSRFTLAVLGCAVLGACVAQADEGPAERLWQRFEAEVVPVVDRSCVACHGNETQRADLNFQSYTDLDSILADLERWEVAMFHIEDGVMPPEGVDPRPDQTEIQAFVDWVESLLAFDAEATGPNPGRVTLRRLNRAEYNNTIRDLIGVDFQASELFPADEVGYGFDNIGDVLSVDPLLMEKYLQASEEIARRAIDDTGPSRGPFEEWRGGQLRRAGGERHEDGRILTEAAEIGLDYEFKGVGTYILWAQAYGRQAGGKPVRMEFRIDGEPIETVEVTADDRPRFHKVAARLEGGRRRFAVAFVNPTEKAESNEDENEKKSTNKNQDEDKSENQQRRALIVSRLRIQGPGDPITEVEAKRLADEAGGAAFKNKGRELKPGEAVGFDHEFPDPGEYRIRVRAFRTGDGSEAPRLAFQVGDETAAVFPVEAPESNAETFEVRLDLEPGARRIAARFEPSSDAKDDAEAEAETASGLVVQEWTILGPIEGYYSLVPESHNRVIVERPLTGSDEQAARANLKRLADRGFRRPATEKEVDRLMELYRFARQDGDSFEAAMRLAIQGVLASPHFLFRVEYGEEPGPDDPKNARPLSPWELASRLSYFLWSSMPDEELFEAARSGALREPEELRRQVMRMLEDPKAGALVANFGGQWLQIRNLERARPDSEHFPEFDDELRSAMKRETELFFEAMLRENRPILEFLDADYTYLNERLAKHYGVEGVEGGDFRRVALPAESPRGGVLAQASVLTITSDPTRTSPVKRGKYILEQFLGTPPPPPPPDVPELEESAELEGTLRERMEQHSSNPICASCHRQMDPLGFGFEPFDAIGRWRETDGGAPIDASGTLPDGSAFDGPSELKRLLKQRSDQFAKTFAKALLTYALGRGLEPYDRKAIDQLVDPLRADDHRVHTLIQGIVTSDPFRYRSEPEEE